MSKNLVLMRDVITRYHPEFVQSRDLCSYGLKHSDIFNVERLVEECLAAVGGYQFVDQEGYDFSDFSDSKTVTVNAKSRRAEIHSVECKIGALRITTYNPHKNGVDFFFVPERDLSRVKSPCYGKNSHGERIAFTWNNRFDHYNWFESYRLNSFAELARSCG
jgi:hypothetical protein